MEKVIFKNEILDYLDGPVYILFKEEYFSYPVNARFYVDKIVNFVSGKIFTFPHKQTPKKLLQLGSNYIFYKANNRTTWYIFFEKRDQNYLITGIINNHSEEAKEL